MLARFSVILAMLALPIGIACAQELEADGAVEEFVFNELLAEQVEEASFVGEGCCDVGCAGNVAGGCGAGERTHPGFRPFVRGFVSDHAAEDFDGFRDSLGELSSVSIGGQHIWSRDWGPQNRLPAWRAELNGPHIGLDVGWLPMSDVRGMNAPKRAKAASWWGEFAGVSYFGYGVGFEQMQSSVRSSTFFGYASAGALDYGGYGDNYYNATESYHRPLNDYYDYQVPVDSYGVSPIAQQVIHHDVRIKHQIVGPKFTLGHVGAKGRWLVDIRGQLHLGYAQIENYQRVFSPHGGTVRFVDSGEEASVDTGEELFAQVAELRLQCSYFVCHRCTLDLHWRGAYGGPFYDESNSLRVPWNSDAFKQLENTEYLTATSLGLGLTLLR